MVGSMNIFIIYRLHLFHVFNWHIAGYQLYNIIIIIIITRPYEWQLIFHWGWIFVIIIIITNFALK